MERADRGPRRGPLGGGTKKGEKALKQGRDRGIRFRFADHLAGFHILSMDVESSHSLNPPSHQPLATYTRFG